MSIQSNFLNLNAPFIQISNPLIEGERNDEMQTEDHSSIETTPHPCHPEVPSSVIENIFVRCLRFNDVRSLQALTCLNKNFLNNIRYIINEKITKMPNANFPHQFRLINLNTVEQDPRASILFHVLNCYLAWSFKTKVDFSFPNCFQDLTFINDRLRYEIIANDHSSGMISEYVCYLVLNSFFNEVQKYLACIFPEKKIEFPNPSTPVNQNSMIPLLDFFKRLDKLFDAASEYTIPLIGGCDVVDPHSKIQYQDKKTHEVHTVDIEPHTCINYAFYRLHEEKAKHIIFENYAFNKFSDVFPFLINYCGYYPVKKARKGDLICYFIGDRVTHFGDMVDSKTVHSKWTQLKPIFSHPIGFIPREYGYQYVIFRKNNAKGLSQPWVFDSERMHSKRVRGSSNYLDFKFTEHGKPGSSFSKYLTLCGQKFLFWSIQNEARV